MEIKKGIQIETNGKIYILRKGLGSGGNGQVWLAKASDDSQEYAIKFLDKCDDPIKITRFVEEINFCEATNNPHIIHIFEHGNVDGQPFYIMPVYKLTLSDIIKKESNYAILLSYISDLCDAIKYIHDNNVIHRDIKPENILINKSGILVLADFGIAHFMDSTLTKPKDWLANKAYAAPEQLLKGKAQQVTSACDIYALGAIINEMFTKQKPSGSRFTIISDSYPFLFPLDHIVERCLHQNPEERPSIDEVLTDIKLLQGSLNETLADIKDMFLDDIIPTWSPKDNTLIATRASVDALSAKHIFEKWSDEQIGKLNSNYHQDIRYKLDDTLRNAYFQRRLLRACEKQFNYESAAYANRAPYTPLNLSKETDLEIYHAFEAIVDRHRLPSGYYDYSGKILKLFASCCDYHCKEILSAISRLESATADLMNAPILYIVIKLRDVFCTTDFDEFDILDHLAIDWSGTIPSCPDEPNLYIHETDSQTSILNIFKEKWDIIYSKIDTTHYFIRFKTKEQFLQFRTSALELAKPYYVFEGDVISLTRVNREFDDIVELVPWGEFDITCTLAKILGLRNDY